jgi:hypothetical protein
LYAKGSLADIEWSVQRASPFGEVGGVGLVRVDIVPEPFDRLRMNSTSGMPSILDQAFMGEL